MQSNRLPGRTALVTGSTSGIGRAIAVALAAQGAHVAVSGRDGARGDEVVAAIRDAGGHADFVAADIGASADAARALATDATRVLGGRVDILVNNAGVYPSAPTPVLEDSAVDAMLAVNIRAPHTLVAALAPGMAERGEGNIINIGSWVSRIGLPSGPLYASTKAAIEALTRGWSAEFGPSGVRVNAVSPGVTLTGGTEAGKSMLDAMAARTPAGRVGTPEEVAAAVVWLASDEASFVHGTTLDVDGGALNTYAA
jgi:NAD(P)-dependent dehydrogenase (short-subunit alcohol dehydrogenase family)